jgi:hypothetical protein
MKHKIQIKAKSTNLGNYGGTDAPSSTINGEGDVEFFTLEDARRFARRLAAGEAGNGEYKGMTCIAYTEEEEDES